MKNKQLKQFINQVIAIVVSVMVFQYLGGINSGNVENHPSAAEQLP